MGYQLRVIHGSFFEDLISLNELTGGLLKIKMLAICFELYCHHVSFISFRCKINLGSFYFTFGVYVRAGIQPHCFVNISRLKVVS